MVEDDFSRLISCLIQNYYLSLQRQIIKTKRNMKRKTLALTTYICLAFFLLPLKSIARVNLCDSALIPVDSTVRIGHLPNGLTYYIKYNNWPENRACFYLAQRVGSLQEEDNQRGLAHFLEHMCFNGSEHFPGNGVDRFFERIGSNDGVNAYTSIDETVYNIDDIPTTIGQNILDSCLLVLYDWANGLSLDSIEIEKERGVIHEEWRSGRSARSRIYERQLPILYPDSKYGHRNPIGLMDVVDNFKHQELRDYYEKWYNPENQCVVVVGDIDADEIEGKIKQLFGSMQPKGQPGKVVREEVADHQGIIYSIDRDKELQDNSVFLMFKHKAYTPEDRKYVGYWRDLNKTSAALTMLNIRFSDEELKPDCSYLSASVSDDDYMMSSTKAAFQISCYTKDGMQTKALTDALAECRRAVDNGFTPEEYQRYQAEKLSRLDNLLMASDKRNSSVLVEEYYGNYLYGTDMSSVEDYVAIMKQIVSSTTLDEVNLRMKELLPAENDNMVIGCWNIEKDSTAYPTEQELEAALMAGRQIATTPYVDQLKDAKLLSDFPQKGSIVKEKRYKDYDYTRLTLSNGATVLLKHTEIDKSQVLFKAYGKGGWTLYGEDDDPNITMFDNIPFGKNGLTSSQIEKLLSGKQVSLGNSISQRQFTFTGSANPVDLETLMQLIYADFTNVTKDTAAYNKALNDMAIYLRNRKTDPESAFSDSVSVTSNGHHPRFKLLTEEDLAKVSHNRILSIIQDQTSAARNYTFLFVGNYDEATIRSLIEQYLASLPNRKVMSEGPFIKTWLKNDAYCHFKRKMETPKAMVSMDWFTESIPNTLENRVKTQAACEVLNMLYNKIVLEENSATYGCYANYYMIRGYKNEYQIGFTADCEMHPEKCDSVLTLMKSTFTGMAQHIDPAMLSNAKETLLKSLNELVHTKNGFWLGFMWDRESRGIDTYTNRRKLIEQLTPQAVQKFMQRFLKTSHFTEILMQPAQSDTNASRSSPSPVN